MREINFYKLQLMDLELFLNVAKYASFTKAGEKMFMTQSWVSKRINLMENELGLRLFIRNKREVTLTPAGQVLEHQLEHITDDILKAVQAAHTAQTGVSGFLRVGFLEWGTIVFMDELERFIGANPQISVEIYRKHFSELREYIATNRMDLIFTTSYDCDQFLPREYHVMHVASVPLMAYMHRDHPMAQRAVLEVGDLRATPLLMLDVKSSPGFNEFVQKLFAEHKIRPLIAQYAHDGGEHIGSILLNKGILLASQCFLDHAWEDKIARVPLHNVNVYISAVWKKQNNNPALTYFLEGFASPREG